MGADRQSIFANEAIFAWCEWIEFAMNGGVSQPDFLEQFGAILNRVANRIG
jgi:hypothetical protein